MIRICILDDKSEDRQILKRYFDRFMREHPAIPLKIEIFSSAYDVLDRVRDYGGYDLYLLDILMPDLDGIEVAKKIRERGEKTEILFLTISREYAIEAFGVKAAGYLVKPIKKEDFEREVMACIQRLAPEENPALVLKTSEGFRKVHVQDVVTLESFNHRCTCTLADGMKFTVSATLSSLYEQLCGYGGFFLPHRSYIINLEYVNGLTCKELIMHDGRKVPVSRNVYAKLKQAFLEYTFHKI